MTTNSSYKYIRSFIVIVNEVSCMENEKITNEKSDDITIKVVFDENGKSFQEVMENILLSKIMENR